MRRPVIALSFLADIALATAAAAQPGPPPAPQGQPTTAPSGVGTPLLGTVPAALTALQAWTSACVPMANWRAYTVYVGLAGAATIQSRRFVDAGCTMRVTAAWDETPLPLGTANCPVGTTNCGTLTENDGLPAMFMNLTITDTSNAGNAVKNVVLIQGAK